MHHSVNAALQTKPLPLAGLEKGDSK